MTSIIQIIIVSLVVNAFVIVFTALGPLTLNAQAVYHQIFMFKTKGNAFLNVLLLVTTPTSSNLHASSAILPVLHATAMVALRAALHYSYSSQVAA